MKRQLSALRAGEAVFLQIIGHVLDPANLLLEFLCLSLVIIGGLDKAHLAVALQKQIVIQTLISGIRSNLLIFCLMEPLHGAKERLQRTEICPIGKRIDPGDEFAVYRHLNVIGWL